MSTKTSAVFEEAYAKLNAEQKRAVDTVEGPIMVLAGPGTGKTHVLTLRIANILRQTQARPDAILALTFTDSAARTMRRRLAGIVGDVAARAVTITTFHGFAELVRAEYPSAFADRGARRLMGDVEQVLLMRTALDRAALEALRPVKAPYTYLRDLLSLYDNLVREEFSLERYRAWGTEAAARLSEDESLTYKRGGRVGELTKAGLEKVKRFEKVEEAARVLEAYRALKDERGLEDFADLLSGAIRTIAENEELRADLQERFQYVLADEHQDANALQHRLLELFAYDDYPNLFVVGDEKQAIYRFQGADLAGFSSFTELFPRATIITLSSSFRSLQGILDVAHEVIAPTGVHTPLAAVRGAQEEAVTIVVAEDPLDERAKVAALVEARLKAGIAPHEIAIIARTNDTADLVANALTGRGVPTLRAGDLSLVGTPTMHALFALLAYVGDPTRLSSLRAALLAPWWPVPVAERARFLRMTSDHELSTRLAEAYPAIARLLDALLDASLVMLPAACFSYLFAESGARDYLLAHGALLDDLVLVRKLMQHLEDASLLMEGAPLSVVVDALLSAQEEGLSPVKVSVTEREGFVTVITAHKSKGMEFAEVIIPDATEQTWEKGGRSALIPSPFERAQSLDDARRLLYVALTRAKNHAYLSYARENASGRERALTALVPHELPQTAVESDRLPLLHVVVDAPEKVRELTAAYLETEGLSPSAVNEFIASPPIFFARRVLRIKEPPEPALVYGSAVHAAIAALLSGEPFEAACAALERSFSRSLLPRDATFDKLRIEARCAFDAVQSALPALGEPIGIEKGFSTERFVDGVPVALGGKIDAIFKTPDGLVVADIKTGSAVSAKNEDYARQVAFYALILAANDMPPASALLLGISEDGLKRVDVPIAEADRAAALTTLDVTVRELRSGAWHRGEPSSYDALLALFDAGAGERPAPRALLEGRGN